MFAVTVLPGYTVRGGQPSGDQVPGHDAPRFLAGRSSGSIRSPYEPAGSTNLDGLLGHGHLPGGARASPTPTCSADDRPLRHRGRLAGLTQRRPPLGVTPYQAITVASIVQKEAMYPKNLGPRSCPGDLQPPGRGMPLQMDSTVLYAEHRDGGPVTPADLPAEHALQHVSAHRAHPHAHLLPVPGVTRRPRCAPAGDWLYFVVVVASDGTEAFSDTFAGQEANEPWPQSRGLRGDDRADLQSSVARPVAVGAPRPWWG